MGRGVPELGESAPWIGSLVALHMPLGESLPNTQQELTQTIHTTDVESRVTVNMTNKSFNLYFSVSIVYPMSINEW